MYVPLLRQSLRQLAANPIELSPEPSTAPFAPPSSRPVVTGLPPSPSKHARSRKGAQGGQVTRSEQDWAMLDAGDVVVHVMTADARDNWAIEKLWENVERDTKRDSRQS